MFLLVVSLVFVLSLIIAVLLAVYAQRKGKLNIAYKLRRYNNSSLVVGSIAEESGKVGHFNESVLDVSLWDLVSRISTRSGFKISLINILWMICAFLLTDTVTYLLCSDLMFSIVIGLVVVLGISVVIEHLASNYRAKILDQLIHSLELIADSIRVGYTFPQALEVVVKEMGPPINYEFERVVNGLAVGMTLEEAFEDMRIRVKSFEFDIFAIAVLINQEFGGNLAELLKQVSNVLYERQCLAKEMDILAARGKITAVILSVLPILIAGMLYTFIDYDFLATTTKNDVWCIVLIVGIILNMLGYIVIRRITDIKI